MTRKAISLSMLATIGAFGICIGLAEIIPATHWGYAISVNFLFMMAFTLLFDGVLKPTFASPYFSCHTLEQNGRIYRWAGIRGYVWLLRGIGWERLQRKDAPIKARLESLCGFERITRSSEAIHSLAAVCVTTCAVWAGVRYSAQSAIWLCLVSLLVNVYPVMLQRHNRPRVQRAIRLLESRTQRINPHIPTVDSKSVQ